MIQKMIQTYEPSVVSELPAVTRTDADEDLARGGDEVYTLKPLASRRMTAHIVKTQIAPFRFVDEDAPELIPAED